MSTSTSALNACSTSITLIGLDGLEVLRSATPRATWYARPKPSQSDSWKKKSLQPLGIYRPTAVTQSNGGVGSVSPV